MANKKSTPDIRAKHIVDVFRRTIFKPISDTEPGYAERDNILYILRMVEAGSLNHAIHIQATPQPRLLSFGRGTPLAITISKPGILDPLLFVEDTVHSQSLGPNELGIEVKAIGINFMDCQTIPVTGVTAHSALIEFARPQKGESILIYSATGGAGQLAVQTVQLICTEVYATVG